MPSSYLGTHQAGEQKTNAKISSTVAETCYLTLLLNQFYFHPDFLLNHIKTNIFPVSAKQKMSLGYPPTRLTWMTTRGDWEKYHSGRPNRLMRAVLVSYVSEQRVLRILPPEYTHTKRKTENIIVSYMCFLTLSDTSDTPKTVCNVFQLWTFIEICHISLNSIQTSRG